MGFGGLLTWAGLVGTKVCPCGSWGWDDGALGCNVRAMGSGLMVCNYGQWATICHLRAVLIGLWILIRHLWAEVIGL